MTMNRWNSKEVIEQTRSEIQALQAKVEGDKKEKSHHHANAEKIYTNLDTLNTLEESKDATPAQKHQSIQAVLNSINDFLSQAQASKKIKTEEFAQLAGPIKIAHQTLEKSLLAGWQQAFETATINPTNVKFQQENAALQKELNEATKKLNQVEAEIHEKQLEIDNINKQLAEAKETIEIKDNFIVAYKNDRIEKDTVLKARDEALAAAEKLKKDLELLQQEFDKLNQDAMAHRAMSEEQTKKMEAELKDARQQFNIVEQELAEKNKSSAIRYVSNKNNPDNIILVDHQGSDEEKLIKSPVFNFGASSSFKPNTDAEPVAASRGYWKSWATVSAIFLAVTAATMLSYLGIFVISAVLVSNPVSLLIAGASLLFGMMSAVHAHHERVFTQTLDKLVLANQETSKDQIVPSPKNNDNVSRIKLQITQSPKQSISSVNLQTEQASTIPTNVSKLMANNNSSPLNRALLDKQAKLQEQAQLEAANAAKNNMIVGINK